MKNILGIYVLIFCSTIISGQANWSLEKNNDDIKVWTKEVANSSINEFKLEAIINENIETVVAALIDLEQLNQWYSYISEVKVDTVLGTNRAQYYITFDLPWPVRDRYAEVDAHINMSSNKAEIFLKAFDGKIKSKKGLVRVLVMTATYLIEKKGNNKTYLLHTGHMEPAGLIPAWLANSGVSDGPYNSISQLKNRLHKYRGKELPIKY